MPGTRFDTSNAAWVIWVRISIEHESTDGYQGIVAMWPDLGDVEGIEPVISRVLERHDLYLEEPRRMIPTGDRRTEIAPVKVEVFAPHRLGLGVGHVLDSLFGPKAVLDPHSLACVVHPHVGTAAISVHMAIGARRTPVAHESCHLVGGFGRE
jgi:hypothetical protein